MLHFKFNNWLLFPLILVVPVMGAELNLKETLRLAIKNHPVTEADKYREQSKESDIGRARAFYFPRLNAMALKTTGFPGSAAALGVAGLMASPFKKGFTAGFFLEQELFDFGRTSAEVTLSKKRLGIARADSKVNSIQIGSAAVQLYTDCARDKSLAEIYRRIYEEAKIIQREVMKFVSTGQRSIVDRYLSESQTEEVETIMADYKERTNHDVLRLQTLLGVTSETAGCLAMDEELIQNSSSELKAKDSVSPLIVRAQADVELSVAQTSRSRKDYYPRFAGIASFGYMQDTKFGFPIQNYSAAIGFIFPLFEGLKTNSEVERGLAETMQKEKELAAAKLALEESNEGYDKDIQSAQLRIDRFRQELMVAEKGFQVAKTRYFANNGTLIDLRETLRNLERVESEKKQAESDFLSGTANKALLNGGLLEEITH